MKEKKAGIGGVVASNIYSGFYERVYFAGMPSEDSFSLVYQTAYVHKNPNSKSNVPHACNASVENVQERLQLFYPLDTKEVEFPGRKPLKIKIENVTPTELTALVDKEF